MAAGPARALTASVVLGAAIWALSVPLTGATEPWDADPPYYYWLTLLVGGAASGAIAPKPLWAHYVGALVGQAGYALVFLPLGPLFVLGLAYLAAFSLIFAAAAAAAAAFRKDLR